MQKVLIICILLLLLIIFSSCEEKKASSLVESLIEIDSGTYLSDITPETINEYTKNLELYEEHIEEDLRNSQRVSRLYERLASNYMDIASINREIGELSVPGYGLDTNFEDFDEALYVKVLALKSMDFHLYSKAMENLRKAIDIDGGNPSLYYLAGLSAGWIAKSIIEVSRSAEKDEWLRNAEGFYKRALDIDPGHVKALYGMAVLLGLERSKYDEAIVYGERILLKQKRNFDALFLLARLYYGKEYYEKAMAYYDMIIELANSENTKSQARALREQVKGVLYGG